MIGQLFVIIFKGDKAYLTPNNPMTFRQLGLHHYGQSFASPAFWEILVLRYNKFEDTILAEVKTYNFGETFFLNNQKRNFELLDNLKFVAFQNLDYGKLLKAINGNIPKPNVQREYLQDQSNLAPSLTESFFRKEPIKQKFTKTFTIHLKKVQFKFGCVSFKKKLDECKDSIEFTISNYDIREEFDAVKNYFANVLDTKQISVTVNLEIIDGEIISKTATSPEIEKINSQLIESVRFEFLKATIKKRISAEIDKSLFTMDEYFDTFSKEKHKANTFYNNDKDFLEDLIHITNTKHYKHLRFLSSKHSHQIMKLRFVLKPFSFIFLIEGDRNYHIIWETIDTKEATYVWHIEKDIKILKMTLRKIEDIINVVKVQGKQAYYNSTEDTFRRIYHDYSDFVDGFVKWKGELESYLT